MEMDLVTGLSSIGQTNTLSSVQMAVTKKVLDTERAEGAGAIQMLQAATQGMPGAGSPSRDPALSLGLGGQLDATA
jgi:hypothetical protein